MKPRLTGSRPREDLQALLKRQPPVVSAVVYDPELRVLLANERFLAVERRQATEVVGKPLAQVLPLGLLAHRPLIEKVRAVAAAGGHEEVLGVRVPGGRRGEA